MKKHVIIPARYASTRLPGKPLIDLNGIPMVVRTFQRCALAFDRNCIFVATESHQIKETCEQYGINVLLTSENCLTGTDRVAESAELLDSDIIINVQGDEPLFNPADLKLIADKAEEYPDYVLNGYSHISSEEMFLSTSVPKVVFDEEGFLLYMSRAPIPGNKHGIFNGGWRQVCAYSFNRSHLRLFHSHGEKTPLEKQEDIEILRFLELGVRVKMVPMSNDSIAVDLESDVANVRKALVEAKAEGPNGS